MNFANFAHPNIVRPNVTPIHLECHPAGVNQAKSLRPCVPASLRFPVAGKPPVPLRQLSSSSAITFMLETALPRRTMSVLLCSSRHLLFCFVRGIGELGILIVVSSDNAVGSETAKRVVVTRVLAKTRHSTAHSERPCLEIMAARFEYLVEPPACCFSENRYTASLQGFDFHELFHLQLSFHNCSLPAHSQHAQVRLTFIIPRTFSATLRFRLQAVE